ncbi:MAG: hypothetical protein A2095_11270 [Sphingomonadales bacterium GWF1_63_6]|nr:MAG: hypothetical protein A2095_11270 [Sphingomonadales bacterium GWF1_63_6]
MTCRTQAAPPLPRAIRESLFVTVRDDGSALVLLGEQHVTCQDCHRAAAMVIVRGTRYRCVDCEG